MDIYFLKQFDGFVKDSIWDLYQAHTPYPLESYELLFEGAHTFAGSLSGNCDTDSHKAILKGFNSVMVLTFFGMIFHRRAALILKVLSSAVEGAL